MKKYDATIHGSLVEDRSKHILAGIILLSFGLLIFILPSLFVGIAFNFDFNAMFPMPILPPLIIGMLVMIPLAIWGLRIIILGISSNKLMRDPNLNVGKAQITKAAISSRATQPAGGRGQFIKERRLHINYGFTDADGKSRTGKAIFFFSPLPSGGDIWTRANLSGNPRTDARVERFTFKPNQIESPNSWNIKNMNIEIAEVIGREIDIVLNSRSSAILSVGKISKH